MNVADQQVSNEEARRIAEPTYRATGIDFILAIKTHGDRTDHRSGLKYQGFERQQGGDQQHEYHGVLRWAEYRAIRRLPFNSDMIARSRWS
jgi:hypothetical protein